MIYTGYNKKELDRVTAILDQHGVQYEIGVPENMGKVPRDSAMYQINLTNEELDKVPSPDRLKLADLRIFGEMESPFTEEDFKVDESKPVEKKKDPKASMNQWAAILAIAVILFLTLWRKGLFN